MSCIFNLNFTLPHMFFTQFASKKLQPGLSINGTLVGSIKIIPSLKIRFFFIMKTKLVQVVFWFNSNTQQTSIQVIRMFDSSNIVYLPSDSSHLDQIRLNDTTLKALLNNEQINYEQSTSINFNQTSINYEQINIFIKKKVFISVDTKNFRTERTILLQNVWLNKICLAMSSHVQSKRCINYVLPS